MRWSLEETVAAAGKLGRPGQRDVPGPNRRHRDVVTAVDAGAGVCARLVPPEGGQTEGGEALLAAAIDGIVERTGAEAAVSRPATPWHVLWTHSHCEQLVCEQLAAKGFHPFVPHVGTWSTRAGQRRLVDVPMFPGYVFVN